MLKKTRRYGEAGMLRRYFQEGGEAASEAGEGQKHQRQTKLIDYGMFRGPCLTCKAGNLRRIRGALLLFLHPPSSLLSSLPSMLQGLHIHLLWFVSDWNFQKGLHILDFHVWAWFLSSHSLYKDACGCIGCLMLPRQVPIYVMLQLDWLADDGQSLRYKAWPHVEGSHKAPCSTGENGWSMKTTI